MLIKSLVTKMATISEQKKGKTKKNEVHSRDG